MNTDEKIISVDDDAWDWRAGNRLLQGVSERCRFLAALRGRRLVEGYYTFELFIEDVRIWVGEEDRVQITVDYYGPNPKLVYASHAQVSTDWRLIQTRVLPLLRREMVLEDISDI